MRILVLGGTAFLGRHIVEAATARGHAITLFNRGSRGDLFPGIEKLRGDRNRDLSALTGHRWDAAIDTSGYVPSQVRASAGNLAKSIGHYTFISSVSVYSHCRDGKVDESTVVDHVAPERLTRLEAIQPQEPLVAASYGEAYGGLKALCEQAVTEVMNGRALNVRAGLLVGPYDYTDRFTYWPTRIARGGEVLAPGDPRRSLQLIDVRDLAGWLLALIEQNRQGTINATGPDYELTMGGVLEGCRAATRSDATFTWVADAFLLEAGVRPWTEVPLWVPRLHERPAFVRATCSKAIAAGLTFRPLTDTIRDTLAWDRMRSTDEKRRAGLSADRERTLLRAWHGRTSDSESPAA